MHLGEFKKWLAFGSGVGIAISGGDLLITVIRMRPGGVTILGESTITGYRDQPAAEWGQHYASFLEKMDAGHRAATVLLPRDEIVVRQVNLPGVSDQDLASAIRFELDGLHPYAEGEAVYDWVRIGKSSSILVGIARREMLDSCVRLFAEAGVKVSAFTCSAAVIYPALRIYRQPAAGFLAWSGDEAYGESESKPIFSAQFESFSPRTTEFALSELRLAPETEPTTLESLLPQPLAAPADIQLSRTALPYATALAGAVTDGIGGFLQPALSLNLLPKELRQGTSRLRYVPSAVLASLVLLLATAALAYPRYADRRYLALLQGEIHKLEPRAKQAVALDRQTAGIRNRTQVLDDFRRQTKGDLDAVREMTQIVRPPAWLNWLQLTREQINIAGEAEQAAPLLKLLDSSKYFRNSEFSLPLSRGQGGDLFSIRMLRRTVIQ
jgi:Tfp pilus assembly protein PilN